MLLITSNVLYAEEDDTQRFQGFNLQGYTEEGEKSWDVKGDTADIKGTAIQINNVVANSFGDQKMNLTAESGTIDQATGNMHLENDVVITSEEGSQLMTDSLDWQKNDDLVTTDDDVYISDRRFTATGRGMEAHPNLKDAIIEEEVTVTIDMELDEEESEFQESQKVMITCDGPMVIDQAKSMATFEDNVVAVQDGQTLKADRMEIHFNTDMNDISEMICIGNVVIVKGENETYAQKATYNAKTQKLVLSGRPKLIMLTEGDNAITSLGN